MDHLPLPHDSSLSDSDRVPYVCRRPYDCGPLPTYPLRSKPPRPYFLESEGYADVGLHEMEFPTPLSDLEDFMQTWLFFGLLSELLGDDFHQEDYIVDACEILPMHPESPEPSTEEDILLEQTFLRMHDDDQVGSDEPESYYSKDYLSLGMKITISPPAFLSTRELSVKAEQKLEQWKSFDDEGRKSVYGRLMTCLRITYHAMAAAMPHARQFFNSNIRRSIAGVAETVQLAASMLMELQVRHSDSLQWTTFYNDDDLDRKISDNGWCKSETPKLIERAWSLTSLHFLSHLKNGDQSPRAHSKCGRIICTALQNDLTEYKPFHRQSNCDCAVYDVDREAVDAYLSAGSYPVLRMTRSADEVRLDVVPYQPGQLYVAISHVWAHGLGNPFRNALYQCQLLYLHQVVSRLWEDYGNQGKGPTQEWMAGDELLLWIDTLCCPVSPPAMKDLSLAKMRDVYANSECALVLDKFLELYQAPDMSAQEISMRLLTSGWATRMWTLQEATLAPELLVQYGDRAWNADGIVLHLNHEDSKLLQHRYLATELMVGYSKVKLWGQSRKSLREVQTALQPRSVSVPSDEALCLSVLFGFDIGRVLRLDPSMRMMQIWYSISQTQEGIPRQIVFNNAKRMEYRGFRWAPKTFLGQQHLSFPPSGTQSEVDKATFLPSGLHVRYPAWRLAAQSSFDGLDVPWNLRGWKRNSLWIRETAARWWRVALDREEDYDPEFDDPKSFRYSHERKRHPYRPEWGDMTIKLWDFLVAPDAAAFILLPSAELTVPLGKTELATVGVLGRVVEEPAEPSEAKFFSQCPVLLTLCSPLYSTACETAHQAANRLRSEFNIERCHEQQNRIDGTDLVSHWVERIRNAAFEVTNTRSWIAVHGPPAPDLDTYDLGSLGEIGGHLTTYFHGHYALVDETRPSTYRWCVD